MIRRTEMQLRQVPGALSRHLKTVALATAAAALVALLAVGVIGAADPPLIFVEVQRDNAGSADGLQGAISVSVSPDGKHLYAAAWNESAVAVFSRDPTTGALTFVEVHKDGVGGVDGLANAYSVTVSPDGNHVYAAGEADSAVAVFSRNSTTGALTFTTTSKDGVGGVDGLAGARSVTVITSTQQVTPTMRWRCSAGTRRRAPSPGSRSTRTPT